MRDHGRKGEQLEERTAEERESDWQRELHRERESLSDAAPAPMEPLPRWRRQRTG